MTENARQVFKVPAENLDRLQSQIEVVNKRVERIRRRGGDVSPVEIKVGEMYTVKKTEDTSAGQKVTERVYVDVELLSPRPPKLDGWEFVAALTHVEGVGPLLRVVPGAKLEDGELKRYREASPENCDHCRAKRKRTDTFVVRDAQGNLSQVGRQCLQAFTGLANPERLCAQAEIMFSLSELLSDSEDDEFGGGFGAGGARYVTIERYLPFVACSIREDGWLSRTSAAEQGRRSASTCDLAFDNGVYATRENTHPYVPTEKDFAVAAATIEHCEQYFAERDVDGLSDYENSLRVAMASGIAHPKFAGLVASAVVFYRREMERRAKNESWAKMVASSRYQGQVKERLVFENLKVLAARTWEREGDYGVSTVYFYSFVDESSNAYAYFASRDMNLEVGQVVSFNATVKKHEERSSKFDPSVRYQQTVLTRCSLVVRAKLVSEGTVDVEVKPAVVEKMREYHFETSDGRRWVCRSKSRKKGLVVGVQAVVSYCDDVLPLGSGERPVSLVSVETTPKGQQNLFS